MNKSYSKRLQKTESRGDRVFAAVNAVILILLCIDLISHLVCAVCILYLQHISDLPPGNDTVAP